MLEEFDEELLDEFELELDELFELEFEELLELEFDELLELEFELEFEFEFDDPSSSCRHRLRSLLRFLNCTCSTPSPASTPGSAVSLNGAIPACAPKGNKARMVAGITSLKDFMGLSGF